MDEEKSLRAPEFFRDTPPMHSSDTATESGPVDQIAVLPTPSGKSEKLRGLKEAGPRIHELRAKWPAAFSNDPQKARPLASGTAQTIAESMGWSIPYARAVLSVWKGRSTYCQAVLSHEQRIRLDGSASEERVDDQARSAAQEKLNQIAARAERLRQDPVKRQRRAHA